VVNRRPNNPKIFILRNRSKQPWKVTEADGNQRKVDPGMGIELSNRSEVDFGQVKATLDPGAASRRQPRQSPGQEAGHACEGGLNSMICLGANA